MILKVILYPVRDVAKAKQVFAALLGIDPTADSPYYVGYTIDGQDIGLIPGGHGNGMTGPVGYFAVSDIRKSVSDLLAAGATAGDDVRDVGGGRLVATVKDGDGNVIGLMQS